MCADVSGEVRLELPNVEATPSGSRNLRVDRLRGGGQTAAKESHAKYVSVFGLLAKTLLGLLLPASPLDVHRSTDLFASSRDIILKIMLQLVNNMLQLVPCRAHSLKQPTLFLLKFSASARLRRTLLALGLCFTTR